MKNRIDELNSFKIELKELLNKYNVYIRATCTGDTYGIQDEEIQLCDNEHRSITPFFSCRDWILSAHEL